MKFTLFTAVLFSVWMNAAAGDDRPPTCCPTVSNTRIPAEYIVSYTIQEPTGVCYVAAVKFLTKKGIIICSDPESNWAKKVMKIVDGRTTTKSTACSTCTTTMIPTTTHGIPEPNIETSMSLTELPEVTRIDTLQLKTETSDHSDCCLTVTNTRTDEVIVDYHIQDSSLCPIRAVRFHTIKNEIICSDPSDSWAIRVMTALTNRASTEHHVFTTTTTTTAKMISTTVTTTQTETESSTKEIKSISTITNKASSDVQEKSSFTVITSVQTTTDPENSRTISEDMRITTAAQIIDTTPPLTTFRESEVTASTEGCCLTVTENRAAIREIEETPAEDWDYIHNLNRRTTTEQTDKREFIRKTKALEQNRVRSTETTDTLQLDESSSSQINDPDSNNEYFCLKKEPVQYFCIKQP